MKKAFTLAEVLITLGIIGVIVALTLPTVMTNYRNKVFETGLNTAYSLLLQGLSRMSSDAGYTITYNDYPKERDGSGCFYDIYKKYFDVLYDCGVYDPDTSLCMARNTNDFVYKTYSGEKASTGYFDDGQFVLKNGM